MHLQTSYLLSVFPFFDYNGVLLLPWDRVCRPNYCLLSHSQLSLQGCMLVYRAWKRIIYRAHRLPSHLLPALCFVGKVFIASEVKGSPSRAKSYHNCRSPVSEWQFRYRGCDDGLREWQFHFRGCDEGLRKWQFRYRSCDDGLRKRQFRYRGCDERLHKGQFHFGKCDSRFAQEAALISQVADVFCSDFKPWFPIAKASLTPGRWMFTICELIFDSETIAQIKM